MTTTNGELPPAFRWVFCIGFMLIGLIFVLLGGYEIFQGMKTEDWPAAPGTILSSKVQSGTSSSHGPARTTGSSRRRYSVDIRYRYEVDGQQFEGSRLSYGKETYKKRSKAQKIVSQFLPRKKIDVFFDPENPESSVLIKGSGLAWLAVALGAGAFILGLVVLVRTAKGTRRVGQELS